jgi:hypothetical protein
MSDRGREVAVYVTAWVGWLQLTAGRLGARRPGRRAGLGGVGVQGRRPSPPISEPRAEMPSCGRGTAAPPRSERESCMGR